MLVFILMYQNKNNNVKTCIDIIAINLLMLIKKILSHFSLRMHYILLCSLYFPKQMQQVKCNDCEEKNDIKFFSLKEIVA